MGEKTQPRGKTKNIIWHTKTVQEQFNDFASNLDKQKEEAKENFEKMLNELLPALNKMKEAYENEELSRKQVRQTVG